jgi:hypothetical protein
MAAILTDLGEEYVLETALNGVTLTVGLYNDSTDAISDTDDLTAITTEPAGASYARQSDTFSLTDSSGDWQLDNDTKLTFDTSDSSQTVDSYFIVANFQADDTGDGSATDHLICTGALPQSRDLSNVSTYELNAGTVGFKVS